MENDESELSLLIVGDRKKEKLVWRVIWTFDFSLFLIQNQLQHH